MNAPRRRCVAFVRSPAHEELWTRCTRFALPRDGFCTSHREAAIGAVLGFAGIEEFQGISHATETQRTAKRKAELSRGSIDGDRALREGFRHRKIALRRLIGRRKREREVARCERAAVESKVEEKTRAESGVSLESHAGA